MTLTDRILNVREICRQLVSIELEDEVKNAVINSGDAKAMVRRLWKVVELHVQHYSKIQRESTNEDCSVELHEPKKM
jgi:hypothetical protein